MSGSQVLLSITKSVRDDLRSNCHTRSGQKPSAGTLSNRIKESSNPLSYLGTMHDSCTSPIDTGVSLYLHKYLTGANIRFLLPFHFVSLFPGSRQLTMGATVENTYGALLLGAFLACCFSGIVTVQSFLYIKMYPKDRIQTKSIVGAVWLLDTLHTCLVMASVWNYLIPHFGDIPRIDFIPWTVASTIAITATLTIIVHCFLARRIHSLTKNAWRITAPILILAILRLCSACVTTAEMIRLKSFKEFSEQFRWVFTLGLALSSSVDVLITITLCYKLRSSRTGSRSLDNVIDSLVLYSFENGSLTCAGTVLSMIFWLTMPYNRLFLALHFIIAKLYANSLLATLNMRKKLRDSQFKMTPSGDHAAITFPEFSAASGKTHARQSSSGSDSSDNTVVDMRLQINVQKTVDTRFDEDEDEPATPDIV